MRMEDGMICELYLGENIESFYIYVPTEEEIAFLWSSRSDRLIMLYRSDGCKGTVRETLEST